MTIGAFALRAAFAGKFLRQLARRQPGCQALMGHYGVGELTALVILCELGDVTRLSGTVHGELAMATNPALIGRRAAR